MGSGVHADSWLLPRRLWVFPGRVSGWEMSLGPSLWSRGRCCVPAPLGSVAAHDRNRVQGRTWGTRWVTRRGDSTLRSCGDPQQGETAAPFGELPACQPPGPSAPTRPVSRAPLLTDRCSGRSERLAGPSPGGRGTLSGRTVGSQRARDGSIGPGRVLVSEAGNLAGSTAAPCHGALGGRPASWKVPAARVGVQGKLGPRWLWAAGWGSAHRDI